MPFLFLIIGALLFIAAYQNTHGDLAKQLGVDVPPYLTWALAIGAIGAIGWVPGFKTPSRWLLALVLVVIVMKNYQAMLSGFQGIGSAQAAAPSPTPATAAAAGQVPTAPQIAGTSSGTMVAGGGANLPAIAGIPQLSFDPSQFTSGFGAPTGGLNTGGLY